MASITDLLAIAEDRRRHELIDGQIVEKAEMRWDPGMGQSSLLAQLEGPYQRGIDGPGGWWIGCDIEVQLAVDQVYRPEVGGWRRDRMPEPPRGCTTIRPDWVCEVLSRTTSTKMRNYHSSGVRHLWLAVPDSRTLLVYRWEPACYMLTESFCAPGRDNVVPFEAIALSLSGVFESASRAM